MCMCVYNMCLCECIRMTAVRAALLSHLILSHLRSSTRIIKPISRWWLLQPASDWIATRPLPSDLQRERVRNEKTGGKKEMKNEINKDSCDREVSRGWMKNSESETERAYDQNLQDIFSVFYLYCDKKKKKSSACFNFKVLNVPISAQITSFQVSHIIKGPLIICTIYTLHKVSVR